MKNNILRISSKPDKYQPKYVSTRNLIKDRIEFASKVDVYECPDVQNFLMEKAGQESFLEWARKPEERSMLEVKEEIYWNSWKGGLRRLFSFITP